MKKVMILILTITSLSVFSKSPCEVTVLNDSLDYLGDDLDQLPAFSKKDIVKVIKAINPKIFDVKFSNAGYTDNRQLTVHFGLIYENGKKVCTSMSKVTNYKNNIVIKGYGNAKKCPDALALALSDLSKSKCE